MRRFTKKTTAGVIAAVTLVAGAGAAYAYWTTTGSGSATSTTAASLATLTTTQNGTVTAMAPGGAVQDVDFTINNSAVTNQYVTTVAMTFVSATYVGAAGSGVGTTWVNHPAGGAAPGCTGADFTLTPPVAGVDVPPAGLAFTQATDPRKGGRIAMNNLGTNQDDCKDTTIALAFAISSPRSLTGRTLRRPPRQASRAERRMGLSRTVLPRPFAQSGPGCLPSTSRGGSS